MNDTVRLLYCGFMTPTIMYVQRKSWLKNDCESLGITFIDYKEWTKQ